jgi:hypothetical protein
VSLVQYQLRIFEIRPGEMDAWIEEWSLHVVPLRDAAGFRTFAAWRTPDGDSFVWVLAYDGDFEAADSAYYASAERAALQPDPARHVAAAETRMLARLR